MRKKRSVLIILALAVGLGMLCPFETVVLPAWKITVVDEHGVPYLGQRIRESWRHYSLELEEAQHEEERSTDKDGRVEFPARTIRMSALGRFWRTTLTSIIGSMHGSTGVHAYISTSGPQGWKDLNYEPNKPVPERLVLPRRAAPEKSTNP